MSFEFDIIGILPDTHHTDVSATDRRFTFRQSGPRFYSEIEADILEATNSFNIDCDCMVSLGDLIDVHTDNSTEEGNPNNSNTGAEGEALIDETMQDLENFTGPIYIANGNWDMFDFDFQVPGDFYKYVRLGKRSPETIIEIAATTYTDKDSNPKGARYYMFQCTNGALGIVLDTTGKSADDPESYANEDTTKSTNTAQSFVPETQRTWLINALANHTDSPIVVFMHYWLYPVGGYLDVSNASTVRTILEDYNVARIAAGHKGRVLAVFSGHHHPGTEGWWRDTDNPTGDPTEYVELTDPDSNIFGVELNKIKYFNLRCPIVGWGSSSISATDDGAGGEATPANSFYKATVGEFVKGVFDIKVEGFGANPVGNSKASKQYLMTKGV